MGRMTFATIVVFFVSSLMMIFETDSYSLANNPISSCRHSQKQRHTRNMTSNQDLPDTEDDSPVLASPDNHKEKGFKVQTRNPLRWLVLRAGLTEPRMLSSFNYGKYDGTFQCAYCGATLFDSNAKYDSGSGWPSFWRSATNDSISYRMEFDNRLECRCKRCSSHLGHVFLDGPQPASVNQKLLQQSPASDPRSPTRRSDILPRFCINGAAMTFQSREKKPES